MKKNKSYLRLMSHFSVNLFLLIICIGGCLIAFSKGYHYTLSVLEETSARKTNPNIRELSVTVTDTTSLNELSETLFNNDFIKHKKWFILQGKLGQIEEKLYPGTYSISSNMSNDEMLSVLAPSQQQAEEVLKFTIPEGFTIAQIAQRLDEEKIVKKEDFLKAVNEREYDYAFLKDVPSHTKYKLEGYLFPDTYIVRKGASAEEIIIKMLNQFEYITDQYTQYLHGSTYSLNDILTIASIIEQEAKIDTERPIISGVIYNRLNAPMKLQMCSTIQYVLEKRKSNLSYDDLEIESPYNTYKYEGLPIGPICSPGEASIKAAFLPESNNYYYFVLVNNTSGEHAFGETASQHETNKVRYQQTIDKNFYE